MHTSIEGGVANKRITEGGVENKGSHVHSRAVSYTHLTLPTTAYV